jgi:hypothetical protein
MMVQVHDFGGDAAAVLEHHGYRRRPEPWNLQEVSFGTACRKRRYSLRRPAAGRATFMCASMAGRTCGTRCCSATT